MRSHPGSHVACLSVIASCLAQVGTPPGLGHHGVVAVRGERFTGTGAFRFALVDVQTGVNTWTHDGSKIGASCGAGEDACRPDGALSLAVVNGVYTVLLGDVTSGAMQPVPIAVFNDPKVALRVWFDDLRGNGVHRLAPDTPLTAAPYALRLPNVYVDESTGNVGVGTETPSEALDIERAGPAIVGVTAQAGAAGVRLRSDATGAVEIQSPAGSDELSIRTAGVDRLHISLDGNVGVGTAEPQQRLDVAGIVRSLGLETGGTVGGVGFDNWDRDEADDVITTSEFGGDVAGVFDAIVVLDDSHSHTDAKVSDDLSINNGLLYAMSGGELVGVGTVAPQSTLHVEGSLKIGDVLTVETVLADPSDCCYAHEGPGCDDAACADMVCAELTGCCTVEWDLSCVQFGQDWASQVCGPLCQSPNVDVHGTVRLFGARTLLYANIYQPPQPETHYFLAEGAAASDGFVIAKATVSIPNALFQIHGWIGGTALVAASVNSVVGSDFPVRTNGFTMPVRIGEVWKVSAVRDAAQNQPQHVQIYWQPLGQ